jgi:nucleoside-diphosphate-sugar epimerase
MMATIFVTGATGVLGRSAVANLLDTGHTVRALARNEERAAVIRAAGAQPIVGDLYDVDEMKRAIEGADTVMHLATRIPPLTQAWRASAWAENTELREVGTRVLVDAALANGVYRFVAESISLIYCDRGAEWIDEQSPVDASVAALAPVVVLEHEVERFAAEGGSGVVLRFGSFYGPDARSTDELLRMAKWRLAPALGDPNGYFASIDTDDAGRAVAASVGAPAGVYNVVDDVPLTRREYADAFAAAFELGKLRMLPKRMIKLGGAAAEAMMRSQRVAHGAFTAATGWTPQLPSAVEGWRAVAAARKESSRG